MKVSAARSAQVPAVVLVDATELDVVGAGVIGVVGVVLETGAADEDVEDGSTEVVALVEVVATLVAVPQAQSNVKTPTTAIHRKPRETEELELKLSTVARSERLTGDYRARRLS
jgi:hypothetical protein